jgi:cyclohexanecarboxyl-CoA dehydrogenase
MNPNPYINEELQALAETVRRFADEKIKPGFLERDKTREFDRALLREMGELGFICPEVPEEFGGANLPPETMVAIHIELWKTITPYKTLPDAPNLAMLLMAASPEQRKRYAEPLARGEKKSFIAIS